MLTATKTAAYDVYFRILIPNGNNSTNRLSRVNIGFYEYISQTPSVNPTAVGSEITNAWLDKALVMRKFDKNTGLQVPV